MTTSKKPDSWQQTLDRKGYVQLPNCLFRCQGDLKLSFGELGVLCSLLTFAYNDMNIYPSVATLCRAGGASDSTIRRHIRSLEKKKYIGRRFSLGHTNTYDITPLINKLAVHKCNIPVRKRIPRYLELTKPPPPNMTTKEYSPRRKRNNNGMVSIGDIMEEIRKAQEK